MIEKVPPIISERDRNLSISIFKKKKDDGKDYYSACLQRSYKKQGEEEWHRETINLFPDELLKLAELCRKGYDKLGEYLHKNKIPETEYPAQTFDDEVPF